MSAFQVQSSEMLARLKPFGISFEKSLTDLIKGIRAHYKESPENLSEFLDSAIEECKNELATTDLEVKATAVLKLAYLEMYGFDMSWCNFQILEIMSSSKFQQKRIGYLAAMQSFKSEKDLLILATNQFKKDLNSHNHVEIGLALSGIATIVTPNLAQDIVDDILVKLTHSKAYIRKKAILALFKIFLQYPESLRTSLPRVIEKLDDDDVAVVSATITVICEISKKNPNIFIAYLPKFFSILEDTQNNWLIIRILKLFQSLSKVEPRMKKKILPSIIKLMEKTDATSLVYECISCIVNGGMLSASSSKDKDVARTCIGHLLIFFVDGDANLRFVGLIALISILKIFPEFMQNDKRVSQYVMHSLKVKDTIVLKKGLEICQYLVTEDNIIEIIKELLLQLVPDEANPCIPEKLRLEIVSKILQIASKDNYSNIPNFNWYVTVLKDVVNTTLLPLDSKDSADLAPVLSKRTSDIIARKLGSELKTVATKVPSLRPYLMKHVVFEFVKDKRILQFCPILMKDVFWLMGEYISEIGNTYDESDDEDDAESQSSALGYKIQMLNTLVNSFVDKELGKSDQFPVSGLLLKLPLPDVQIVFIPSLVKLYSDIVVDYVSLYVQHGKLSHEPFGQLSYFLFKCIKFLENWESHDHYEVQERALSWLEFLRLSMDAMGGKSSLALNKVKEEELNYFNRKVSLTNEDTNIDDDSNKANESESEDGNSSSEEDSSEEDRSSIDASMKQDLMKTRLNDSTDIPSIPDDNELPHLLTSILPSFFKSYALNPVAASAQKMIPLPADIDLDAPINTPPEYCLREDDPIVFRDSDESDEEGLPQEKDIQKVDEEISRERLERMKDDPFYITPSDKKKRNKQRPQLLSTPSENTESGTPSEKNSLVSLEELGRKESKKGKKIKKHKVTILSEEGFGDSIESPAPEAAPAETGKKKKPNKFLINSSNLDNFDINSSPAEVSDSKKAEEYDIDLEALRKQLEEKEKKIQRKEAKKAKKKKETKSKEKKEKPKESKESVNIVDRKLGKPAPVLPPEEQRDAEKKSETPEVSTDSQVVAVSSKPKTKKKKKAVILD
ncbi:hypothetical protein FDK38_003858 [Candidozyma auris]|nr:hypothetical protein FDK38_003858 [[Candida] auris]